MYVVGCNAPNQLLGITLSYILFSHFKSLTLSLYAEFPQIYYVYLRIYFISLNQIDFMLSNSYYFFYPTLGKLFSQK